MSPIRIVNPSLYLDRTVQDWHRSHLPEDCTAIDLDLMGACPRCYHPLYLIESSTRDDKPVGILRSLARKADVPALLVLHDTSMVLGARLLEPLRKSYIDQHETAAVLQRIRLHHDWSVHRSLR